MNVRVFAPAKINLTLKVGPPRADGLHPLASVVAFADVGDWVEAAPLPDWTLHIDGPFARDLLQGGDNIIFKAMSALTAYSGAEVGASIRLEKNLPVASGIGGGSSDAAAALKALNQLWGLHYSEAQLVEVARALGADVPVCVSASSAYMTGAGERFSDLALPQLHAVLVNPLKPLPTPEVYRRFDAMGLGAGFAEHEPPIWRTAEEAIAGAIALGNDLAAPARALMPEIVEIESRLRADSCVRVAALSGSGATVFALLDTRNDADALCAALQRERTGWWVRAVTFGLGLTGTQ
jgi:4-diphosphocytidyl-2-C-methyl-D-erythritol kinase